MLGTSGYNVRTMTLEEFRNHPNRMVGFNTATGKKDIPMLYNKGKNPIRVIITNSAPSIDG